MKKCPKCGGLLPDIADTCPKCNTDLDSGKEISMEKTSATEFPQKSKGRNILRWSIALIIAFVITETLYVVLYMVWGDKIKEFYGIQSLVGAGIWLFISRLLKPFFITKKQI